LPGETGGYDPHHLNPGRVGRRDGALGLGLAHGEGLFATNMLAGRGSGDHLIGMGRMGRGENDRINIGVGEHGFVAIEQGEPLLAGELGNLVGMAHGAGGEANRCTCALNGIHQILSPPAQAGDTRFDHVASP
jgi:hypothetical protein